MEVYCNTLSTYDSLYNYLKNFNFPINLISPSVNNYREIFDQEKSFISLTDVSNIKEIDENKKRSYNRIEREEVPKTKMLSLEDFLSINPKLTPGEIYDNFFYPIGNDGFAYELITPSQSLKEYSDLYYHAKDKHKHFYFASFGIGQELKGIAGTAQWSYRYRDDFPLIQKYLLEINKFLKYNFNISIVSVQPPSARSYEYPHRYIELLDNDRDLDERMFRTQMDAYDEEIRRWNIETDGFYDVEREY
ncbi:hypothetical protein [Chitinophaga sp. YIM B06452]|uniref:hypothetical protein n=1 Tax=Chitinophaga sp. YIM B06452 TaxID=3082158 RepID=UPI0031FF01DA